MKHLFLLLTLLTFANTINCENEEFNNAITSQVNVINSFYIKYDNKQPIDLSIVQKDISEVEVIINFLFDCWKNNKNSNQKFKIGEILTKAKKLLTFLNKEKDIIPDTYTEESYDSYDDYDYSHIEDAMLAKYHRPSSVKYKPLR